MQMANVEHSSIRTENCYGRFGSMETLGRFIGISDGGVDEVIVGLAPGEMGLLNALPDAGKTTFVLNMLMRLASGGAFYPLFKQGKPRNVAYFDFEGEERRVRADIRKMIQALSPDEQSLVVEHMYIRFGNAAACRPLRLSEPEGLASIEADIEAWPDDKIDLVVIDTLAASVDLVDENSNAEINRKLIQPLLGLIRRTNSAVLLLDHMGKGRDAGLYAGRGASAKAAAARLVMNLEPASNEDGRVTLRCAKIKGEKFKDTVLRLDKESRWFHPTDERPSPLTHADKTTEAVINAGGVMKRADIITALASEMSRATVERALTEAVKKGALKQSARGVYSAEGTK